MSLPKWWPKRRWYVAMIGDEDVVVHESKRWWTRSFAEDVARRIRWELTKRAWLGGAMRVEVREDV